MADVVAFQAGGGRKKVEEAKKAKEELNELSKKLLGFANRLADIARREAEAEEQGTRTRSRIRWEEAIDHLSLMFTSSSHKVREVAAATITTMARTNHTTKIKISGDSRIMPSLVKLMNEGSLDAISAVEALVDSNELACDQARMSGAIGILAGFINMEDAEGQGKNQDSDNASAFDEGAEERARREKEKKKNLSKGQSAKTVLEGVYDLADLRGGMLEQAFVQLGVGADERPNAEGATQIFVPLESKREVVAALRHIATSNDANREVITREKVIPALVKLMTKMQANADDGKSGTSGMSGDKASRDSGHSGGSGGSAGSGKKGKGKKKMEAALERKQLAQENRRLAESAGQMLHQLILEGRSDVKQLIISAIIATVQQPGSTPPEDVPALMAILRSAAEEQLHLVQREENVSALQAALEFGRWIKVPTIMLGEARNNFRAAQEARKRKLLQGGGSSSSAAAGGDGSTVGKPRKRATRKKRPTAEQRMAEEARAQRIAREAEVVARATAEAQKKLANFRAALARESKAAERLCSEYAGPAATNRQLSVDELATERPAWSPPVVDADRYFMLQDQHREQRERMEHQMAVFRQYMERNRQNGPREVIEQRQQTLRRLH